VIVLRCHAGPCTPDPSFRSVGPGLSLGVGTVPWRSGPWPSRAPPGRRADGAQTRASLSPRKDTRLTHDTPPASIPFLTILQVSGVRVPPHTARHARGHGPRPDTGRPVLPVRAVTGPPAVPCGAVAAGAVAAGVLR
jgi:hypothetical protein